MVELVLRAILSLALVIGLLWLIARFSSRRMRGSAHSTVQVVTRQQLGRGSSLAVVNVGERTLVLGMTEHQVQLITELDATLPEQAAEVVDEPVHRSDTRPAHRAEPAPAHEIVPVAVHEAPPAPAHRAVAPSQEPVLRSVYSPKHARVVTERPTFEPLTIPSAAVLTRPPADPDPSASAPARSGLPEQLPEQSGSALAGSVLSGQTWKQAFAAATKRVGKAS